MGIESFYINIGNLSFSSYSSNQYLFECVDDSTGKLVFSFGYIAEKIPSYINAKTDEVSIIEYQDNQYLHSTGEVNNININSLPLSSLQLCFRPNDDFVKKLILKNYYYTIRPNEATQDCLEINNLKKDYKISLANIITINDLADLLRNKKVLIFTGAGISINAGINDLNHFTELQKKMFLPDEKYYRNIINNSLDEQITIYNQILKMLTISEPTKSHYIIKDLCYKYGFSLATGNIDSLHQKTGIQPIFQNNLEISIPNLEIYDILLTIGLSDIGAGLVPKTFCEKNKYGIIIAINKNIPKYLNENDYYIKGDSDDILDLLLDNLNK